MQVVERIKRVLSLTMLMAFVAYGLTRCVSYISYVSNFGLVLEPHGYVSTIPFMVGASAGVIVAGLALLWGYLSGRLKARTVAYKLPILAIVITYTLALVWPSAFDNNTALAVLGLIWGVSSTLASTAALEFLLYEPSSILVVIALAAASLLTAFTSLLMKAQPGLAGPLDIGLAIIAFGLIRRLRKQVWPETTVAHPSKTLQKTLRLSMAPILASAIFELVVGLINMFSFSGASTFQIETDSPVVGMLLSGVVVTIIVAVVRRAPQEQIVYSVVYPAVIGIILLLPFFGEFFGKAASTLLYTAYLFTSLLSMFCCLQACQRNHDCLYGVMGVFTLALRVCLVIGLSLGWWLGTLQNAESFMRISLACVICIYLLGLVLVLRNIGKRFSPSSMAIESAPEALAVPAAPLPAKEAEVSEERFATTSPQEDTFNQRLDTLTATYGLTNRERDVLAGLAAGNTAASIAEELCLSTSTVQSYTKTLYAKLGLNKKQQVIDLVTKNKDR